MSNRARIFLSLLSGAFLLLGNGPGPAWGLEDSFDPHRIMLAQDHYQKALKLLSGQNAAAGESELLEAVKIFPEYVEAHLQLGDLSMGRKDYTQGLERYLHAREALTTLDAIRQRQEVERQRRIQESIDILRANIEDLQRSQRPRDQGRIEEQVARIEKLEQERTKPPVHDTSQLLAELHFRIGTARMSLEQFDEARTEYENTLALRPGYGEAHNNLAVILMYRKDYPKAWEHVHAAEKAGVKVNAQFREELAAALPEPAPPAAAKSN